MISKFIAKVVGEKGQWRQYQARARQLPASYRYPKVSGSSGNGSD
jgi:DNA-binding ferritin-like protein (Dps family)